MSQTKSSLGILHLSAFLLATTGLFSKLIDLPAWDITAYRTLFAAIFLLAWVAWREKSVALQNPRDYWRMLFLGLLLGVHWTTYFYSMQISNIAVGMLALFIYPVITVFLEPFVKKTKLDWVDVLSGFAVFAGVYFLVPAFDISNKITQGVLWGLLSAMTFAVRNLFLGRWFSGQSAPKSLGYQVLVVAVLMLPVIVRSSHAPSKMDLGLLVLLGLVFTAVTHALLGHALRFLKAKTVALVACMQPVYGIIFGVIFIKSIPNLSTLLGGIIIVSTAIFESVREHRKKG